MNHKLLVTAIVTLGFSSLVGQAVLMRELVILFTGNELTLGIMLAIWLLWTAVGSGVFGKILQTIHHPRRMLLISQISIALLLPLSGIAVRLSKNLLSQPAGEITSPLFIVLIPLIALAPVCILFGFIYPLGCRLFALSRPHAGEIPGRVFFWESIGAGIAGFVAGIFFFRCLSNFEILALLSFLNLVVAALLFQPLQKKYIRFVVPLLLLLAATFAMFTPRLDFYLSSRQWRPLELIETRTTIYGDIAVTKLGNSLSFYENGMLIFSHPDEMRAEESVHYALLEHPTPKSVLLIGGSVAGSLEQILHHSTVERLDFVMLDPALFDLARKHIPSVGKLMANEKIRVIFADGRKFIQRTPARYDVIIVDLPDPQTTLINRFYTREFFIAANKRLTETGMISFSITSSENVLSQSQRDVLNGLFHTLNQVFPDIFLIPGNTVQFIACNAPNVIERDPQALIRRISERRLPTQYVREYFIPFRMSPGRLEYIAQQVRDAVVPAANTDFHPIGYFNSIALWLSSFSDAAARHAHHLHQIHPGVLLALMFMALLLALGIAIKLHKTRPLSRLAINTTMVVVGFTAISLEVVIILGFQAMYGYAFYQLALIMSGYMIGLTLGSLAALSKIRRASATAGTFLRFQVALAGYPLLTFGIFTWLARNAIPDWLFQLIFLALIVGIGFIGGFQFPVANHLIHREGERIERTGGALYALDLTGSVFGAFITSAFLVPLFGLGWICLFFCGLNAVSAVMFFSSQKRTDRASAMSLN
ncbi:MAG: fused MFS/spermidine synthase [Candidatus Zhuqueibacterota bacterium]